MCKNMQFKEDTNCCQNTVELKKKQKFYEFFETLQKREIPKWKITLRW